MRQLLLVVHHLLRHLGDGADTLVLVLPEAAGEGDSRLFVETFEDLLLNECAVVRLGHVVLEDGADIEGKSALARKEEGGSKYGVH